MAIKLPKPVNPFFTGASIPDAYFCDREQETSQLISLVENGKNVVLMSQRRIGKSSLINHVCNQSAIKERFNTLYVDLYGTRNYNDFVVAFQTKLLAAPFAVNAKIRKDFDALVKGMYFSFGSVNAVSGTVEFPRIGATPAQQPKLSLESMFGFLEKTKKPTLVVFDEFQQIESYPERMAAVLRSYIQQTNNARFIFSGSSKHMLNFMFHNSNQPFYKSSMPLNLDILQYDKYLDFAKRCFAEYDKSIDDDAVKFIYELFCGETAHIQDVMNITFSNLHKGENAGIDVVKDAVGSVLDMRDGSYRQLLNGIEREKVRNTLFCIAAMGVAKNLTSGDVMASFRLDNASSVQNALLALTDERNPVVRKLAKGTYVLDDRMFEIWIAREGNYLDMKYENAASRMELQRSLECPKFDFTNGKSIVTKL